jgi:FkbM family methyltransferase
MSFSQNSEEFVILDFFKDKPVGKFIDVGAYSVERFSNTRALYLAGWSGILVEPSPPNFKAIDEHYKDEPRIAVLNFAVGDPPGQITFYESNGDAVGTTDHSHMLKWKAGGVQFNEITVEQVGTKDFFEEYGHHTDFISIDTEATNIDLFRNIPDWFLKEVKLICIEHDGHNEEIEERLLKFGFQALYLNAENIILGKV